MGNCHYWSEEDFDWKGLGEAGHIIWWLCTKIGRVGIHQKEKYGTLRVSSWFWNGSLHELIYPGYVSNQFPQWLWSFDIYYITPLIQWLRFPTWIMYQWQKFIYMLSYYIAMRKYPHIREEICVNADHPELIIGGKVIYDKYWEECK